MLRFMLMLSAVLLSVPTLSLATVHSGKIVNVVYSPDSRDCVFFTLVGVNEADPVTPAVPYFAVPKAHLGYKEIVSILLSARLSRELVTVSTTGAVACGHAAVGAVSM